MTLPHIDKILSLLSRVKHISGHQYEARCPAHDDSRASLSISQGKNNRALIHCHAGCRTDAILRSIGLPLSALFAGDDRPQEKLTATYDYTDAEGTLVYQVLRYEPKNFRQRRADGTWNMDGVPRLLYRLPDVAAASHVIIVEGEKDVDNILGLIHVPGSSLAGYAATCNPGGAGKWLQLADDSVLARKQITVIIDKDKSKSDGSNAGRDHAKQIIDRFPAARAVYLPGSGKDASDWISAERLAGDDDKTIAAKLAAVIRDTPAHRFVAALERCREALDTKEPGKILAAATDFGELTAIEFATLKAEIRKTRVVSINDLNAAIKSTRAAAAAERRQGGAGICISGRQLREITADAVTALSKANSPPEIYLRIGQLARLRQDEDERLMIEAASESFLRGLMERSADYFSVTKEVEERIAMPPTDVVKDVLALDINRELARLKQPKLPALQAIVETPVMRKDGTIFSTPGYDPVTRLYYSPSPGFGEITTPDNPSDEDVDAARELLEEMLCDFPFVDESSKANAIAAMITCPLRPLLSGNVPLCMFDKPQPGTGGSLLAESIAMVATGRDVSMSAAPSDEEEWRKKITVHLMTGRPIVIWDNVEHLLESDSLAQVLTSTVWNDRILGSSKPVDLPARTIWMATGNNVSLGRQLVRRVYQVRIDAQTARPERRTGFKHPELLDWIKQMRSEIISAILTLCRAWAVAGRPEAGTPVVGSFENWCRTIGGILEFAGIPGFLGNLEETRESAGEDEFNEWEGFLSAMLSLYRTNTFTISQIVDDLSIKREIRDSLPVEFARSIHHVPSIGMSSERWEIDSGLKIRLGKSFKKRNGMRFGSASQTICAYCRSEWLIIDPCKFILAKGFASRLLR